MKLLDRLTSIENLMRAGAILFFAVAGSLLGCAGSPPPDCVLWDSAPGAVCVCDWTDTKGNHQHKVVHIAQDHSITLPDCEQGSADCRCGS